MAPPPTIMAFLTGAVGMPSLRKNCWALSGVARKVTRSPLRSTKLPSGMVTVLPRSTAQTRMSHPMRAGMSRMGSPSSPWAWVRANLISCTRPPAKVSILEAPGKRSSREISVAAVISGLMMAEMPVCWRIKSSSWL